MENLKDVKGKVQTALAIIINIAHKSKLGDLKDLAEDIEAMTNDHKLYENVYNSVAFQELCGQVADRKYKEALHWADVLHLYVDSVVEKVEVKYGMTYSIGHESITIVQSLKSTRVLEIQISPGLIPMG